MTTKYFLHYNYRYDYGFNWDTITFDSITYFYDFVKMLKNKGLKLNVSRVDYLKNGDTKVYDCFIDNNIVDTSKMTDIIKIFGKKNATKLIND